MPSRIPRLLIVRGVLWFLVLSGFTPTDGKHESLIQILDTHYYYPQKAGLQKLKARVTWERQDISSPFETYRKNPSAWFHWNAKTQKRYFSLTGNSFSLPEADQSELEHFFSRYREMLLPETLEEQFAHLPSRIVRSGKKTIEIQFQDPVNTSIQYHFLINQEKNWIERLKLLRPMIPETILSSFLYTQKERKWLVSQSRATYRISDDSYWETTRVFYHKLQSFWLVQKIQQTLTKNGKPFQKYSLRLDRYRINEK